MDLVILAGGIGSRFGGLKQLEPIDDNGNFIIDFSVFDAIRCGFNRIIFIIREENLELFRISIGIRIEKLIPVIYVFQKNPDICKNRTKPLGTAHALLSAKGVTRDLFAVINADDFYGYNSFAVLFDFLSHNKNKANFSLVGFSLKQTVLSNSSYKRGICSLFKNKLKSIDESLVTKNEDCFEIVSAKNKTKTFSCGNNLTSVNMFGFSSYIFDLLEAEFCKFLKLHKKNLSNCEFFLPEVVSNAIEKKQITVNVLKSNEQFFGITYKEDLPVVKSKISSLKNRGIYPSFLW